MRWLRCRSSPSLPKKSKENPIYYLQWAAYSTYHGVLLFCHGLVQWQNLQGGLLLRVYMIVLLKYSLAMSKIVRFGKVTRRLKRNIFNMQDVVGLEVVDLARVRLVTLSCGSRLVGPSQE